MPGSDLSDLVAGRSEDLGVEYKAWMDTSEPEARAKLARHIAALANHGGGYLIFGVDDTTREPMGETTLDRRLFGQDAVAGIVRRYLDPRVPIRVEAAEHAGVSYPVVIVPGLGARPIVAIADGPQDANGRRVGIRLGEIYIRAAGPESAPIRSPDDWNALIERCLTHRADLLGNILRQTIARPGRPSAQANELLRAATETTANDFSEQTQQLAAMVGANDQARVRRAGDAFSTLGYAFIGDDGETLEFVDLRGLNDRVNVAMHQYAYNGWAAFLPLTVPERAPQIRTVPLLGQDRAYLEGMRLPATGIVSASFDYWRIYEAGVSVTAQSYWEDAVQARDGGDPYLTVLQVIWRLHSLLAHARLAGQETPGVQQVLIRTDWRGIGGRRLLWDQHQFVAPGVTAGDRFVRTMALHWGDLRGSYFECLRRVALPFLDVFPSAGWTRPAEWLTRERVEQEFAKFSVTGVLPPPFRAAAWRRYSERLEAPIRVDHSA
jgi:hypothetical protein